jgi:PhnB protein
MTVQPYLSFEGRCEEAIEFYTSAVGAKVLRLMRFKENPEPPPPGMTPPGSEEKVMHAALQIGDSTIMASDGRCMGQPNFHGISLTLSAVNAGEADRLFKALAAGGTVTMPLTKTFFSSGFGMLNDRFGVSWMILAPQ